MLELHAWGPAFGLPSIDPECLATITYLTQTASSSSWQLIYSNDISISPGKHFPALNHDGVWTTGFKRIISYLTSHSLCENLDENLTASQKANTTAYSAFLSAYASPLLDLSLYVSAANWSATTRPAYSKLLSFPLTWTIPPLIRQEAINRVEHLGLAELDTDFDPNGGLHLSTGRDALPETFRRHLPLGTKKTVRDEMTPEQATAIRLFGMTEDCLSVLEELLSNDANDGWLLRPDVSSLDCLAFGYLAIMREAPVPRSFLRDWMAEKAPRLTAYIEKIQTTCLAISEPLPIATTQKKSFLDGATQTFSTALLNTPGVGDHYATELRQRAEQDVHGVDQRSLILAMSLLTTSAAVGFGVYFFRQLPLYGARTQVWRANRGGSGLGQFGDLGFMLDSALGAQQPTGQYQGLGGNASSGRLVETDSEVD